MKYFAIAALASVAAAISDRRLRFANFIARFNKVYEDVTEFALRFERFVHWDKIINEHNYSNDPENFKLGHNQFSDWTDAEYASILRYIKPGTEESEENRVQDFNKVFDSNEPDYPANFSLVEAGAVTPV